jgi:aspartate aminotransferase-like enzyme
MLGCPMSANVFNKEYLMTAGPTPLPPAVSQVMAEPMLYHRAPAFIEIYARVLKRLKDVFQTENEVLLFASSGTGAMESAVANPLAPDDVALVTTSGKFGERWGDLCDAFGAETLRLDVEWGTRIDTDDVDRLLDAAGGRVKAVYTTHSETSTGVVNDVRAIAEISHRHGAIICVDAVSSLGVVDLPVDEWDLDVVASGSQKALMTPPGLSFCSVSERAYELARDARERGAGSYYFDWAKTRDGQRKEPPDSPFTPAVSLVRALDVALELIETETIPKVFERHAVLGRAAREAVKALGLELFGPEDDAANIVTAVKVPEGVDGAAIPKTMRDTYRITIAGGQGHLKGKIIRIAHCGYYGAFDILSTIAALEMTLKELGAEVSLGAGVTAAQQVFVEAGLPAVTPVA